MRITINEKSEILNFAKVGSLKNSLFIDDSILPGKFFEVFKPKRFILEDEQVKYNPDFNGDDFEKVIDSQPIEADEKDEIIMDLTNQLAETNTKIENIHQAFMDLTEQVAAIQGGNSNG